MIDGLLHPALAFGALLAAVPILIHLLNRRRHRPVAWGAMRFALAAYRRTRRRAQFENLLLLLLRALGIALLAFALSRPFVGGDGPLAALTESRRDVILVLDRSASTGYREHVESVFERIVERGREIALELDGARGDRLRLVLADERADLVAWRTPQEALSVLATLDAPSDRGLDLAGALAEVRRSLTEEGAAADRGVELRLLTDMQRRSFLPEDVGAEENAGAPAWRRELDALADQGLSLVVEDLGPAELEPPNLGVLALGPTEPVLGPGLPLEIEVIVANHGTAAALTRVALAVEGQRLAARPLEVPARGTARALFPVLFDRSGGHLLEASLEGDRLPFDDRRARVLDVPPPIRLLAVNGAPNRTALDLDAVGLVLAALAPPDDGSARLSGFAPFQPREIDPAALAGEDLDLGEYDVILLANVESLSRRAVERLEDRVAGGAGLILSLGDRIVPAAWNTRFFQADGTGLLPAELVNRVAIGSRRDGYFRVRRFEEDHPALLFFAETRWRPLLTEVPIYEFVAARPLGDARVLAELDDDARSPLLVERNFGRGRVLLFTSTLDPSWARLARSARTLVPLSHELVRHAAQHRPRPRTLELGAPLVPSFAAFPRGAALVRPDGTRRALSGEPRQVDGRWELDPISDAERAGIWRVELEGGAADVFALVADPREGRLERLGPADLRALHPALVPFEPQRGESAGLEAGPARGGELWRLLAGLCLAALILESLWGAFLGRRRGGAA